MRVVGMQAQSPGQRLFGPQRFPLPGPEMVSPGGPGVAGARVELQGPICRSPETGGIVWRHPVGEGWILGQKKRQSPRVPWRTPDPVSKPPQSG